MRSTSSGFLLLLLGVLGLIGFLTGNLDRWLGYLFSAGTDTAPVAPTSTSSSTAIGNRRGQVA